MKASPITSKIKRAETAPMKMDGKTSENKATEGSGMQSDKPEEKSWGNVIGHGILDVVGLVPVVGELADGANAAWYAAEGDYTNAALSAAAMVPFAGWGATGAKLGMKGYKSLSKTAKVVDKVANTKVGKFTGLNKPTKAAKFYGPDRYEAKPSSTQPSSAVSPKANKNQDIESNKNLGSNRVSQGASSWKRAVANNKSGTSLTNLIKQRNSAKKGSAEYAKAQNAINKAYGVKKRY
jgi:hypothetical protein